MSKGLGELINVEEENDLTRVVFGSLEVLGPDVINRIFDEVQFENPPLARYDQEIEPGADRRIDAILESDEFVLAVEAKMGASYSSSQLVEEYQDLIEYTNKSHQLYLVTGHTSEPNDLDQVDVPEEQLHWIGWDDVAESLHEFSTEDVSHTEETIAALVTQKLQKEGFEPFHRLKPVESDSRNIAEELDDAKKILYGYFGQFNTLRRKLDGLLAEEGLRSIDLFRDGTSSNLSKFPEPWAYIPEHIWITYADSEEDISGKGDDYLAVNFNTREKKILVGYQASAKSGEAVTEQFIGESESINEFISTHDASLFRISYWGYLNGTAEKEEEITRVLSDADWLEQEKWVMVGFEHELDESVNSTTLEEMAEELRLMNSFQKEFLEEP